MGARPILFGGSFIGNSLLELFPFVNLIWVSMVVYVCFEFLHEFSRLHRVSVPAGLIIQPFRHSLVCYFAFFIFEVILGEILFPVGGTVHDCMTTDLVYSC